MAGDQKLLRLVAAQLESRGLTLVERINGARRHAMLIVADAAGRRVKVPFSTSPSDPDAAANMVAQMAARRLRAGPQH